ncbi:hypothetical protein [aff. Roholtiella sp. LEGE 12411]|nr:hypothetical protein [aff. Roholtiella sp. LEGE 12411]
MTLYYVTFIRLTNVNFFKHLVGYLLVLRYGRAWGMGHWAWGIGVVVFK